MTNSMPLPSLVVFGPQPPCPSIEYLSRLRLFLLHNRRLATFLAAIKGLPNLWPTLVNANPSLTQVPGLRALEGIKRWIEHGDFPLQTSETLPNVLLTPLTIIIHIVEYFSYLEHLGPGTSHSQVLDSVRDGGVQGFCTGFLAAISLACSRTEENINEFGAVALRLAVCIGAFVDLDARFAVPPHETSCFTVRWSANSGRSQVLNILKDYSEAYISVLTSTTNATITVPNSDVISVMRRLTEAGMIAKPISLSGRFHSHVHEGAVKSIQNLCACDSNLRFPTNSNPLVPLRANLNGELVKGGSSLEEIALRSMLVELSNWHQTIHRSISQFGQKDGNIVLMIGPINCIPSSMLKELNIQVSNVRNLAVSTPMHGPIDSTAANAATSHPPALSLPDYSYPDNAIAIVGMGCRFPGADSIDEFWDVIQSGKSMLGKLPVYRFPSQGLRRSPEANTQFLGNFIRDADAFDHRFFKKSSREAASMDPQHRLVLQVAYEALESSGYFGEKSPTKDVGCYMGVAASDYEDNVASHSPTAFSVSGMVRAFASGKISHFFGWNGPSIVFDTACSSSAIAIHTACKAIQTDECSMALAGGVNVITSPNLHLNLAAANFLSLTGASKSFDAKADGYCRGEGAGLVLLKKLSSAMNDNDTILGAIVGTAINQNDNCSPITVPSSSSQTNLYQRVLSLARMKPSQVSFVEAHGTGTSKGDPIECQSIRTVFGGQPERKLYFGSVKGGIGHTEAASGVAGLIKSLLMMQHKTIPMQASFTTLNPNIAPLEPSNMEIPTSNQRWHAEFKAACITNYGAAGSNSALIVCEPPTDVARSHSIASSPHVELSTKYPVLISAHSLASLKEYAMVLKRFMSKDSPPKQESFLASIAYNLARRQNTSLANAVATTTTPLTDLGTRIDMALSESNTIPEARPVVLVFAGQTGRSISFCKEAYRDSLLLQHHLNQCDNILRSMHLKSLFPHIFSSQPIDDVVDLHCGLFSLQYSCAKSWLDSGLKVETVIGHSFGQLTALCVAGVLSLEDSLKLISGRASLIKNQWGDERGSMISLDADIDTVMRVVSLTRQYNADQKVEIACYNGPSSYVLVGTEASIKAVEDIVGNKASSLGLIKAKRLDVTHGFHSEFVNNIMSDYTKLVYGLTFKKPTIHLESCSKGESWTDIGPDMVVLQSRQPVYYEDAIRRIEERLSACVWIEAGSGTPATAMVRRAVRATIPHSFHPVKLSSADSMGVLAETTADLWKAGVKVQFWPFHRSHRHCYLAINLPPYQFEKSRHWLDYVDKHELTEKAATPTELKTEPTLLSFDKFSDSRHQVAEFTIDQTSDYYKSCVQGHAVLGSTLCPASLYIEMAARAATLLKPDFSPSLYTPTLEELEMYAPLGIDPSRGINLCLRQAEVTTSTWRFTLCSYARNDPSKMAKHATGRISLCSSDSLSKTTDFARYTRLLDYRHCEALLADAEAETIQGCSVVYKMFAKVVRYADIYQGVRKISSKNREVAGHVAMPAMDRSGFKDSICNPLAIDNFTQVAGLHVNGLEGCGDNEVFLCTKIDQLQVGENFHQDGQGSGPWIVYSNFDYEGAKGLVNDIFVFDPVRKTLVMTILGVRFTKVVITSLRKGLARANPVQALAVSGDDNTPNLDSHCKSLQEPKPGANADTPFAEAAEKPRSEVSTSLRSADQQKLRLAVKQLLHEVADVPIGDIAEESSLEELGIDSLMATELLTEIKETFGVIIPVADFQNILDFKSLCHCLGAIRDGNVSATSSSDTDSTVDLSDSSDPSSQGTPTSEQGKDELHSQLISKLSKLVAEHLDTTDEISQDTELGAAGLDSLLGIELGADIEKAFGAKLDMAQLSPDTTFGKLSDMVLPRPDEPGPVSKRKSEDCRPNKSVFAMKAQEITSPHPTINAAFILDQPTATSKNDTLASAAEDFAQIRQEYGRFAKETGFLDFRTKVYPKQAKLVLAYVIEAFAALGCSLGSLKAGEQLPSIQHLPKHGKVMSQYYKVLEDASLISINSTTMLRTEKPISQVKACQLYEQIIPAFPQHASEHRLLNSTGSRLADCLSGKVDPLQVLFRSKADKDLLEDVYTNSPMFATGTKILGNFLIKSLDKYRGPEKLRILELGAGTGGTTKHIIDLLLSHGLEFKYTFTDLSSSMVATAKKKFAHYNCMEYMVLDVEKEPPEQLKHSYHIVLSSNCVHATKSLLKSSINVHKMLRSDGFLCLLELTRNLYWLDCVFGLLEGWWLFEDGRKHVLADELLWKRTLLEAGFKHVDWSDDVTEESDQFRVIAAFVPPNNTLPDIGTDKAVLPMETVEFQRAGGTSLCADIYYPSRVEATQNKRPIALMVHGGGHIMLSRKDIRPKQTQLLLDNGLLPVSIDYRLCPEVPLLEGPILDVCSALQWARHVLPSLKLQRPDIHPNGDKVVVVGWSTGGTLSMTLAWTAAAQGLKPPDAILAFYCPTDYSSDFWKVPNFPAATATMAAEPYDVLEGVQDSPITAYNVPPGKRPLGGWMSPSDPRSRIALHMNWKGQALPVLLGGLPSKSRLSATETDTQHAKWQSLPQPDAAKIAAICPYTQITQGNYRVPTYFIHGTQDDLIPWQQTQRTWNTLGEQGVMAGGEIVEGAVHLFDLYGDRDGKNWEVVKRGYEFLFERVGIRGFAKVDK